ncbi:MAG: cytochrome-c oxidase [Betaproteobacteria bacterium HGW-Betaproteobacteria-12]|nr:MAG: cytochrome-c oxidase [Betaproteobacteria bacterium HGW-Betaproteobacteria-12]
MPEQQPRGEVPSIWAFITADVLAFALFFVLFMAERGRQVALFDQSSLQLDANLGLLNTLILITSSWLVALGVEAARHGNRLALRRWLLLAMLVGAGFAVTKFIEYSAKIGHGITMLSNDFFMFYFALTGIHFLHFLVGIGVLLMLWMQARDRELAGSFMVWLESGGIYWHMVDLLWIVLFPMLYLLGRSA